MPNRNERLEDEADMTDEPIRPADEERHLPKCEVGHLIKR